MSNQNNNQVEDLKTYKVSRPFIFRDTFEVEVQARDEEDASNQADTLHKKWVSETMTPTYLINNSRGDEEVQEVNTDLKFFSVCLYRSDVYLKVVASSQEEAEDLAIKEGSEWMDTDFYSDERAKELGNAVGYENVEIIDSSPFDYTYNNVA